MPYSSIKELPRSVTNPLPVGAQRIFVSAFNSAVKGGNTEEDSFKIAWRAVKAKYRKFGVKWIKKRFYILGAKKMLSTPPYSEGPPIIAENLAGNKKKKPKKKDS